jgi:hypothetical protein
MIHNLYEQTTIGNLALLCTNYLTVSTTTQAELLS